MQQGCSLREFQTYLRHASYFITTRYAHVDGRSKQHALNIMSRAITTRQACEALFQRPQELASKLNWKIYHFHLDGTKYADAYLLVFALLIPSRSGNTLEAVVC